MSVEQSKDPKVDLVLEGGGVKGIGLLGAITTLADRGYRFPRVAGTSAGAIVGALVAGCMAVGKPVESLVTVMETLDYREFRDGTLVDHIPVVGEGLELAFGRGIYRGEFLVSWLSEQLTSIGVETFGDLRIAEADDLETGLDANQRYRLVVMASDISKGELVRLPWDAEDHYGIPGDSLRIVDAVRASMSIPFFFKPAELATGDGGKVTLVDGGLLSNFPIECFDRHDSKPPRWPTWGVKLSARPGAQRRPRPVGNSAELALACLHTVLGGHDNYHLDDDGVTSRTIFVDTLGLTATDFDITQDQQRQLFANGQTAATTFLAARGPADPAAG